MADESDEEVLRRQLEEVRRAIASISERLQRLKDEEYGLTLALSRVTGAGHPQHSAAGRADVGRPRTASRRRLTPLVRDLLHRSETPLTRAELREMLPPEAGDVSLDAISASLSYLRRQGSATSVAGAWTAASERD